MSDYQTVVVRPKISSTDEDPVGKALAKHGMSKFAGCPDIYIGAIYDRTLGRYLTGLDENHPDVLNLPQDEKKAKQKAIIEEREYLERELGVNLHHTNEEYWSTLPIVFDRGKLYNARIPKDRVVILAITAGKMVPTNKEDLGNPDYLGTNFYIGGEYEDVKEKTQNRSKEREFVIKFSALLDNFEYAVEVANYLGVPGVSEKMPKVNLDDVFSDWIDKKAANKEAFMEAIKEKEEVVRLFNQFRQFKLVGLVRFDDGRWSAGKLRLGKTEKESVKKLLAPTADMQSELSRLIEDYKELTQKN